ncbi:MAG: hypothetical protein O3A25_00955 [Acidobacteria bacterium]|nr:hypothetical protein [Acidobacteriota bacterium]
MTRRSCRVAMFGCLLTLVATPVRAQPGWLTGYLQTVPIFSGGTPLGDSSFAEFSRFRLSSRPRLGPLDFEVAYEHALTLRQRDAGAGFSLGAVPSGGEWLDLDWTVTEDDQVRWRHRFDRLSLGWSPTRTVEVSAGRQAVSWGTTLYLTPADPFLPFSPADPFRQFRGGVDAARVRLYPSPLSQVDLVVRPSQTAAGDEVTALGRGLATWHNWELSGWTGSLYGDVTGAFGAAGGVGGWALRSEGALRHIDGEVVFRGAIGVDRILQLAGRDLSVGFEYQRDNLAAADPTAYLRVVLSEPFRRGEFQVLGRDETVVFAAYQVHPLVGLSGLWLWNLNDRSALLAPSLSYSAGDDVSVTVGVYIGVGENTVTVERPLASEYGLSGTTGFASVSWFF